MIILGYLSGHNIIFKIEEREDFQDDSVRSSSTLASMKLVTII